MLTKTKDLKTTSESLDLSILTEQARRELLDFYQFLLERYGKQQRSKTSLPQIFYKPLKTRFYQKFDREDIYYAR